MELQEAWRDVIRPTMRREPKTPGNRGVEVVMVDFNPDPPEPEYEPLVVGNPTVTGQAIVGYTLSCSDPSIEGALEMSRSTTTGRTPTARVCCTWVQRRW